MSENRVTIHLEDPTDRWRYVCPRGHKNWEPTNRHFWCQSCAQLTTVSADPTFDELVDDKTKQRLNRDEIVLITPAGPYSDAQQGSAP